MASSKLKHEFEKQIARAPQYPEIPDYASLMNSPMSPMVLHLTSVARNEMRTSVTDAPLPWEVSSCLLEAHTLPAPLYVCVYVLSLADTLTRATSLFRTSVRLK